MNMLASPSHSPAALALLRAAENLIAEQGIDGVSSRELARRAGQKNHSAVNYHFGSFQGLVEALIDYRAAPINQLRREALAAVLAKNRAPALADLVGLMLRPLAAQLLEPEGESRYLNLLTQLLAREPWRRTFVHNRARSPALQQVGALIDEQLEDHLSAGVREERLRMLGRHIVQTVAEWDARLRDGEIPREQRELAWRIEDFIAYSVAGLRAPATTNLETD